MRRCDGLRRLRCCSGQSGATAHGEPLQRGVVAEVAMIILDETTRIRTVLKGDEGRS